MTKPKLTLTLKALFYLTLKIVGVWVAVELRNL